MHSVAPSRALGARAAPATDSGAARTVEFFESMLVFLGFLEFSLFLQSFLLGFYKETEVLGGPRRSWEVLGGPVKS